MPTKLTPFGKLKRASGFDDLYNLAMVKGKSRSSRRSSRRSSLRRATVGGRKTRKSPHKRR